MAVKKADKKVSLSPSVDPKAEGYRLLSLRGRDDLNRQHSTDTDAWCREHGLVSEIVETGRGDLWDRCDAIEKRLEAM